MFQTFIYRFKLKFRLTNPFNIKSEYKYLNGHPQKAILQNKEQVNQSTYLMRFCNKQCQKLVLSDQGKCLGTQVGQYISLNDPKYDVNVTKFYCPISRIDDLGSFDLLVHEVRSEKNNFSQHLSTLNIGHSLQVNGPFNSYLYHGYGRIQFKYSDEIKQYRYIGVIAESTGIAAFFQLIESIATNGDNTHIGLYYVADTMEELIFMEELLWYVEERKIKVTFHVRKEQEQIKNLFPGPKGEHLKLDEYVVPPNENTLVMVCGSQKFKKDVKGQLDCLNHKNIQII